MGNGFADNLCCPGTTQCASAMQSIPLCADDTWTLWMATLVAGASNNYFCCEAGQVGLKDGTCLSSDTAVAPSLAAQSLAPSATSPSQSSSTSASSTTSATSSSTAAASGGDNKSSLPASTIGGIVAGGVVGLFLIICTILYVTFPPFRDLVKVWVAKQGDAEAGTGGEEAGKPTSSEVVESKPPVKVEETPIKTGQDTDF
ncbi:hypothetical protein G7Y89_g10311 [Cudoniella acicularis]|uniref:Uncharacterized protein n=1 Tax=Cudoniella acicularis TaxID=354080 RepID=A0A8H4W135_9HELO|nr:hypothetical protein G7Y89_g10311 [Cudoniella acicularis]